MRRSRKPLVIASRRSQLARAQAELVGAVVGRLNGGLAVEYRWIESEGDQQAAAALSEAGGKGLFVRAVEAALLKGEADLAVHSLKDLPSDTDPHHETRNGLVLAALPRRADVRDCLIAAPGVKSLEDLRAGARVGTASPRRAAQLLRVRSDLRIELMRGNIDMRLRKVLEDRDFEATVLAMAGLARAGLARHAAVPLDTGVMLPCAGQGALALQCRADDHVTLTRCLALNDSLTAQAVHAERAVVAALGADCQSAVAVLAEPVDEGGRPSRSGWGFALRARVLSSDGKRMAEAAVRGRARTLTQLVRKTVEELAAQGARQLLQPSASAASDA